jgi:hypothetical protein
MSAKLHQIVAMIYVYRRLYYCCMIAPMLMILTPILIRFIYQCISFCIVHSSLGNQQNDPYLFTDNSVSVVAVIASTLALTYYSTKYIVMIQKYIHQLRITNEGYILLDTSSVTTKTTTTTTTLVNEESSRSTTVMDNIEGTQSTTNDKENHNPIDSLLSTPTNGESKSTTTKEREAEAEAVVPQTMGLSTMTTITPIIVQSQPTRNSNQNKIPIRISILAYSYVVSCIYIRYMNDRFFDDNKNSTCSSSTSSKNHYGYYYYSMSSMFLPSFITSVQLSISMLLYGAMIALRFIGSTSICTYWTVIRCVNLFDMYNI